MTDVVDAKTRSRMMSGIKGKNTSPEILVRKGLHARGFRFRIHVKDLPGKPDLVLPKYGAVVFVHGCFWHGHSCSYFKIPKTRPEFWLNKIEGNRARDVRQLIALHDSGWRVLTVWECAVRSMIRRRDCSLIDQISKWLTDGASNFQIDEWSLDSGCLQTE